MLTHEPVEFEKWPVEVGDLRRIADPLSLRKNWQLVPDELVEFEKWPVEVGDFRRIAVPCPGRTGG